MNEVKAEYKKGFLHKSKPYKVEIKVYDKPIKHTDMGEYNVILYVYNELNIKVGEFVWPIYEEISEEQAEEFMVNTINYFNK